MDAIAAPVREAVAPVFGNSFCFGSSGVPAVVSAVVSSVVTSVVVSVVVSAVVSSVVFSDVVSGVVFYGDVCGVKYRYIY